MPDDPAASPGGVVVDTSALAAVIFREPEAERIAQGIASYSWSVTTSLLEFEVRNVGLVKVRRGEMSFADAKRLLETAAFPLSRPLDLDRALRLAQKLHLTFYDAAYLELARELEVPLVTLDRQLLAADPKCCVSPI